jgi:hypothetical protein
MQQGRYKLGLAGIMLLPVRPPRGANLVGAH